MLVGANELIKATNTVLDRQPKQLRCVPGQRALTLSGYKHNLWELQHLLGSFKHD